MNVGEYADRERAFNETATNLRMAESGRVALVRLSRLNRIQRIFTRNSEALLKHIDISDPAVYLPLLSTNNRAGFEEYLDDLEFLLFNYLAAAESRVDHMRLFVADNWAAGGGFRTTYGNRVKAEFAQSPLHNWLKNLRNCLLHYRLPVTTMSEHISIEQSTVAHMILLHAADLELFDGWTSLSKSYMTSEGPEIDLGAAVATYAQKVEHFHRWVVEQFVADHHTEIDRYRTAEKAYHELLVGFGMVRTDELPAPL